MISDIKDFCFWKWRDSSLVRRIELAKFEKEKPAGNQKYDIQSCLIFDTGMYSNNLGDQIIMFYCNKIYEELGCLDRITVPTHIHPGASYDSEMETEKIRFVSGTNLLSNNILRVNGWKFPRKLSYLKHLCLLGVGWISYEENVNDYTKYFYHSVLGNSFVHSVRDSYTEKQLNKIGINNVINTGCPTMWGLTESHCSDIPEAKAKKAVTTITDYRQEPEADRQMLEVILQNYDTVYFWPQGKGDVDYLSRIMTEEEIQKLEILGRSLGSFHQILEETELDYVGTRLHAGIHALNKRRRSLIVAVDNRAKEISKDTNLEIILRKDIKESLEHKINSKWKTEIHMNQNNIKKWKGQFINGQG